MMTPIVATRSFVRVSCDNCLAEQELSWDGYFAALKGRRIGCTVCATVHEVRDRRQVTIPVEKDRRRLVH